ncbi:MAG: hypothetical protein R6V85_20955 [Polyangia bacterium]
MNGWKIMMALLLAAGLGTAACGDDDTGDADAGTDADADSDADADTDADSDADADTDADTDTGASTSCSVDFGGMGTPLFGACQPADDPCEGGVVEGNEQGDCEEEGQVCCIGTDQCDSLGSGMLSCQESVCPGEMGVQLGCPDSGWCCVPVDIPQDEAQEGEQCTVTVAEMVPIHGTCTPDTEACPAGMISSLEQANCAEGLNCCIDENACAEAGASMGDMLTCEESECSGMFGFHAGCPDSGWCCAPF